MFKALKALFKSGEPALRIIDKVWMSAEGKLAASSAMATANVNCIFICWFQDTFNNFKVSIPAGQLFMAEQARTSTFQNKIIVFAEHHPLTRKEAELFARLNLREVPVLSSLDEPLFMWFGGARTIDLMKKLGMNENEVVGSGLITKAIHNAQQKIDKQVSVEHEANSQQEWLTLNLSSK